MRGSQCIIYLIQTDYDRLTKSYISNVFSNASISALQLEWRLFVAEKHLWRLLVLPSALLELLL